MASDFDQKNYQPPENGKFLYTDVFTNNQGLHMARVEIGSTRQPMNLWLTSHESKMSVVKKTAVNIDVPDKYDPALSTSAIYPSSNGESIDIINLGPK